VIEVAVLRETVLMFMIREISSHIFTTDLHFCHHSSGFAMLCAAKSWLRCCMNLF